MTERGTMWGILLAAGRGSRFGGEKHALDLGGLPLWQWGHRAMVDGGVDQIVIVGDVPGGIPGGERRRDSVAAGLGAIPDRAGGVLVHDAARPLASPELVRRVIDRLAVGDVAGVVPALPVRDTLKRAADGFVDETVDRSGLVAVQTPQGFDLEALRAAHIAHNGDVTDDAIMIEQAGGTVAIVEGDPANLKVTYPGDLVVIESLHREHHG